MHTSVPTVWHKSSHSQGAENCVEVAWFKSSHSSGAENCVEVAGLADGIGVRDSKAPAGPALHFGVAPWSAFLADTKRGRLDLP